MRKSVRNNGPQNARTSKPDPSGKWGNVNARKTLNPFATQGGGTSDQQRIEAPVTIAGDVQAQRAVFGQHRLGAPVLAVVARLLGLLSAGDVAQVAPRPLPPGSARSGRF